MNNLKIDNKFPQINEVNDIFKKVGFPRASNQEYEDYIKETCHAVSVRENDKLIGMAYVTKPVIGDSPYMIYAVAVDPEYQRQGIGTAMINDIIAWYKSLPNKNNPLALYCDLSKSNFYTKFGFVHESLFQMQYQEWVQEL